MLENLLIGVLDVSLQMSLLLLLLFLADKFLSKRVFPQSKCWIWAICSVRLLLPATFSFSVTQYGAVPVQEAVDAALPAAVSAEAAAQIVSGTTAAMEPDAFFQAPVERLYENITVLEVLAIVWAAVALGFLLAHLTLYLLQTRFLRKNGEEVLDEEMLFQLEQVKAEMCVTRPIRLLVCEKADSPMLMGLFQSCLVLPRLDFIPEQLSMVFRHELAHYKRHDLPIKWLLLLVRSVHWFNPLVHSMARKASFDLEIACDDTVLRDKDKPYRKQYGTVLLHVMSKQKKGFVLSTHFSGNTKEIWKRFRNIVSLEPKRKGIALICCMIVGMAAATSSLNPATAQTLTPGMLSLLKATDSTPEEIAEKQALLAQCLKGSMFETYRPYQEAGLAKEDYERCQKAQEAYRKLLKKLPEGMYASGYATNLSFLVVDSQTEGPITEGLFCSQADNDNQKNKERFCFIWLDFSDMTDLKVTQIGTAFRGKGQILNEDVKNAEFKQSQAQEIAKKFSVDLSQYREAYSEIYPACMENQAIFIRSSIEEQLLTGLYQYETFNDVGFLAYVHKNHEEGIVLNKDNGSYYIHYFKLEPAGIRNSRQIKERYPIIKSECLAM